MPRLYYLARVWLRYQPVVFRKVTKRKKLPSVGHLVSIPISADIYEDYPGSGFDLELKVFSYWTPHTRWNLNRGGKTGDQYILLGTPPDGPEDHQYRGWIPQLRGSLHDTLVASFKADRWREWEHGLKAPEWPDPVPDYERLT